jgi:alkylation response protein AidB-like acyl-CoA dehydrogenase
MPLALTDEQEALVAAVRDLCSREAGTREQRDALTERNAVPHNEALSRRIGELGWLGIPFAEEHGGMGGGAVDTCLFLEEVAYGLLPIAGIGPTWIVGAAIERFGSPAQRRAVIGDIVAGASAAIAMSEPGAGSDVAALAKESSMVKLKVTEVARAVALDGMQMMGGYGYATEHDMERHVRDTVVSTIYGGTSEVQREIIGSALGL